MLVVVSCFLSYFVLFWSFSLFATIIFFSFAMFTMGCWILQRCYVNSTSPSKVLLLEMNQVIGEDGPHKVCGLMCFICVSFCTLHLVFVKQWRSRRSFNNYHACFVASYLFQVTNFYISSFVNGHDSLYVVSSLYHFVAPSFCHFIIPLLCCFLATSFLSCFIVASLCHCSHVMLFHHFVIVLMLYNELFFI